MKKIKKRNYNLEPDEPWRKELELERKKVWYETTNPSTPEDRTTTLIIFLIITGVYLITIYIVQAIGISNFSFPGFFGWVLIVITGLVAFGKLVEDGIGVLSETSENKSEYDHNKKYSNPNFAHLTKNQSASQYPPTSFDNFIAGRMSLAKMFWLYFIFIGIILSAIGGYFHALDYSIIIIVPIAYYALVSVALWNCATLYQNEKLANRQSYGWAIGVKIFIVFNIVMTALQILLNFITK